MAAFEAMYRAYHVPLWKYAYQFVHSRDAAQDVVQDVFVDLWERRTSLAIYRGLEAYLFVAVRNRAMDTVRRETRITEAEQGGDIAAMAGIGEASLSGPAPMLPSELEAALDHIVARLREPRRSVLILRWKQGWQYDEIAAALGLSVSAVKMQVSRSAAEIRPLLERYRGDKP